MGEIVDKLTKSIDELNKKIEIESERLKAIENNEVFNDLSVERRQYEIRKQYRTVQHLIIKAGKQTLEKEKEVEKDKDKNKNSDIPLGSRFDNSIEITKKGGGSSE